MKEKIITKGIKIPLYLLHYKLTKNEILILCILNHFNKNKFIEKENLSKKFTINLSKTNLNKLIPLSKNTIKKDLNRLNNIYEANFNRILEILTDDYFNITLNLSSFNKNYKQQGFIFIPVEILYNKKLSTTDKIILSYVKGFKDSNKNFNFTDNYLSQKLNISKRMIKLTLKKLNDLDLIERDKEGNNRIVSINQINIDNYFKDADIRDIKQAKIEKAKIDKINNSNINKVEKINDINKVKNLTTHIVNIINLDSLENIELTEKQKQYIRKKLKL